MIAYVEEMVILKTMPMTEKVEELSYVIGPFYEIRSDKSGRSSDLTSDLGNVLVTQNAKTGNGKAESSDSGAESEEEETQEDTKRPEPRDSDKKMMKKSADHNNSKSLSLTAMIKTALCRAYRTAFMPVLP